VAREEKKEKEAERSVAECGEKREEKRWRHGLCGKSDILLGLCMT